MHRAVIEEFRTTLETQKWDLEDALYLRQVAEGPPKSEVDTGEGGGAEAFAQTMTLSERDAMTTRLATVLNALEKCDMGTYGICEECSEEINLPRLRVVPYTTLCLDCQKNVERKQTRWRRG